MKRVALAVFSGMLLSLSFPSWAYPGFSSWPGWLAWVGLIPLFAAIDGECLAAAFKYGWIAGTTFFMSSLYWIAAIAEMGALRWPAWLAFACLLGIYWGIWALGGALARRVWPAAACFLIPGIWAAVEIARGGLFTGFPWIPLGASQFRMPVIFLAARILGVSSISAGVVATNAALWLLIKRRPERFWAVSAAATWLIALYSAGWIAGLQLSGEEGTALRISCLQGNFTEEEKNALPQAVMLERYIRLARGTAPGTVLTVWPETATAGSLEADPGAMNSIRALAEETASAQLVGAIRATSVGRFYNGAYLMTGEGLRGTYFKRHLVPFGEYIPGWIRRFLPFARKLTRGLADFSPGSSAQPLLLPGGPALGVLICYEAIFAGEVRETVRNGASVLANLTNDAWYRRTAASWQHALGPICRSVEFGRHTVRCANTGVSLMADPHGRIQGLLPLFVEGRLEGKVAALESKTLFCAAGNWPLAAYCAFLVALIFGRAWQGRISLAQERGKT